MKCSFTISRWVVTSGCRCVLRHRERRKNKMEEYAREPWWDLFNKIYFQSVFCYALYLPLFGITTTLRVYNYCRSSKCGIAKNISNAVSDLALAEMLTFHRTLSAVCTSITPSWLNHVVSDLVGFLTYMTLYLAPWLQLLSRKGWHVFLSECETALWKI